MINFDPVVPKMKMFFVRPITTVTYGNHLPSMIKGKYIIMLIKKDEILLTQLWE